MNLEQIKRLKIKENLQSQLEGSIEQRIDRYLEVDHQGIIGAHHFAEPSSECINLYRDGYFISAVMVSQAVNEGIIKFIAEKNDINRYKYNDLKGVPRFITRLFKIISHKSRNTKSIFELIDEIEEKNIISNNCAKASRRIVRSFRNDVHHMNPKVIAIPFETLAKRNLQDLATIEKEIFGADIKNGALVPHYPKYWDLNEDGTTQAYLRLE